MIPVAQAVDSPKNGDCFRACIASILEVPIDFFPNTYHNPKQDWAVLWQEYLRPYGLWLVRRNPSYFPVPGTIATSVIDSPKYKGKLHAVVSHQFIDTDGGYKRRILWDPSPYRDEPNRYDNIKWHEEWVIAARDPRKVLRESKQGVVPYQGSDPLAHPRARRVLKR